MVRFKNRWLLVDIKFSEDKNDKAGAVAGASAKLPASTQTLQKVIRNSLQLNFGDVAAGALGGSLVVKYYSSNTHTAIVRCSRVGVREVWAAMTMCDEWEGREMRMVILHCGGTIRKVQETAIRINRRRIESLYREKKKQAQHRDSVLLQVEKQPEPTSVADNRKLDSEALTILEQEKKVIQSIQQ